MMRLHRKAFTMIELVFVIVVIGILSSLAIPRFAATRDDAVVTKAITTVSALRSAIATERQKRILRGNFDAVTGSDAEDLIEYGLGDRWSLSGDTFTFTCPASGTCVFEMENNKLVKKTCAASCNMGSL